MNVLAKAKSFESNGNEEKVNIEIKFNRNTTQGEQLLKYLLDRHIKNDDLYIQFVLDLYKKSAIFDFDYSKIKELSDKANCQSPHPKS